eukprot:Awhi_evm1s7370
MKGAGHLLNSYIARHLDEVVLDVQQTLANKKKLADLVMFLDYTKIPCKAEY